MIQVGVPEGRRAVVLGALDDEDIEYVVSDETGNHDYEAIVEFPLPTNAVEQVLSALREVGVDEGAYTVVTDAETVVSDNFAALEAEYAEHGNGDLIAREELRSKAEGLSNSLPTYIIMTVVSALVGTAGLLLDSPATVVGSMVIAPLIGPALSASVGTVIDDERLFRRGVKLQALGVVLTVVAATVFSFAVKWIGFVPPTLDPTELSEINERLEPNLLSLVVALGAGVAGSVSLTAGVSTALVGVMIAVALIPPAAAVGIAIAWGLPGSALGAAVLTLVNLLSINVSALAVMWYSGYRPDRFFRQDEARSATVKRVAVLVVAIAVLSVFLGTVTYNSYTAASDERSIHDAIEGAVNESSGVTHLDTDITTESRDVLFTEPTRVVVTVGAPPDNRPPDLAARIDAAVDEAAGRDVEVQVRYVEIETVDRVAGGERWRAERPAPNHGSAPTARSAANPVAQPS
nr:TIGR00341 family protein [Halomarina salina]